MNDCCVRAFVNRGFDTMFRLATLGDRFACQTCGTVYEMKETGAGDGPKWTTMEQPDVFGGNFYGRATPDGPLVPAPATRSPDAWICRRVVDFPDQRPPVGSAVATCHLCGARIAYDPARHPHVPPLTPKRCMQCARIQPLDIETGS
jgi:hypothetical protein